MNKIQTKFGINEVVVGSLYITTIKLKVKRSFPVDQLPEEVKYTLASKNMYLIEYEGINGKSRPIVNKIVELLQVHASNQLEQKYARMRNPLAYDAMQIEAEYEQYQHSQMFDWAEDAEL